MLIVVLQFLLSTSYVEKLQSYKEFILEESKASFRGQLFCRGIPTWICLIGFFTIRFSLNNFGSNTAEVLCSPQCVASGDT